MPLPPPPPLQSGLYGQLIIHSIGDGGGSIVGWWQKGRTFSLTIFWLISHFPRPFCSPSSYFAFLPLLCLLPIFTFTIPIISSVVYFWPRKRLTFLLPQFSRIRFFSMPFSASEKNSRTSSPLPIFPAQLFDVSTRVGTGGWCQFWKGGKHIRGKGHKMKWEAICPLHR